MSLGPIMLDLTGLEVTAEERDLLKHPQVGGIILFTRNYQNPEQLQQLIKQIRQISQRHLLIAVDHEGGRVQRFREGFTQLPALHTIGKLYDQNPRYAEHYAQQHAWIMASELLAFDIDFSFAPILDLHKNISEVIGDRALHNTPYIATKLASVYCTAMQQAGMATVGKHFPGHGSVAADSHTEIPIDKREYAEIAVDDLIPFTHLATQLNGIMPAHVIYEKIDKLPAGFSPYWLQTILRQQLKFNGAIFSDDLSMQGANVVGSVEEKLTLAFDAGCDMALICNDRTTAIQALQYLDHKAFRLNSRSVMRLQKMRGTPKLSQRELFKSRKWLHAREVVKQFCKVAAN